MVGTKASVILIIEKLTMKFILNLFEMSKSEILFLRPKNWETTVALIINSISADHFKREI